MIVEERLREIGNSLALLTVLAGAMTRSLPEADQPELDQRAWEGLGDLTKRAFSDLQTVTKTLGVDVLSQGVEEGASKK